MQAKEGQFSKGQAGSRPKLSRADHVYTVGETIQVRKDTEDTTKCCSARRTQDLLHSVGKWAMEKDVEFPALDQKMWRVVQNMKEWAERTMTLDGVISIL